MRYRNRVVRASAIALLLAGCGGGGGGGGGESVVPPSTGPFSLEVIDAPVDPSLIDRVCIAFSAVTIHYSDDQEVRLPYEALPSQVSPATHCTGGWDGTGPIPPVRLDALSGALTVHLVDSLQVLTGRVTWIRLHFTEGSYVTETTGGEYSLTCPSCEVTDENQNRGFKLNRTFELTSAGLSVIVDIDLRRSLRYTNSREYILRPTARIERSGSLGTIMGNVATVLLYNLGGKTYLGGDFDTGCAVYVFKDDGSSLEDISEGTANVVTTAEVRYTGEPEPNVYAYAAGALPVETDGSDMNYRVALTCDPDDPTKSEPGVSFIAAQTIAVSAGEVSEVDFDFP